MGSVLQGLNDSRRAAFAPSLHAACGSKLLLLWWVWWGGWVWWTIRFFARCRQRARVYALSIPWLGFHTALHAHTTPYPHSTHPKQEEDHCAPSQRVASPLHGTS